MGRNLSESVERKLYAESMGRCMNPNCKEELFKMNGDIIERAHIIPYAKTADNSFENLVILCPNCHTNYDKNSAFSEEELLSWKKIRQQELNQFFNKKFNSFEFLKKEVIPLLIENKKIYEKYYLGEEKELWNIFEKKVLANNTQLRYLFEQNWHLFQTHTEKSYSNLECIRTFILHTEEFEKTRVNAEKVRKILFPKEINSMFGIAPIEDSLLQSTESLEELMAKLKSEGKYQEICLGINKPYIQFIENNKSTKVYLNDTPRIRQLYFNYKCFKQMQVRLESLNWALKYLNRNNIKYYFIEDNNLKEITVNGKKIIFVYEYCLSKLDLIKLDPEESSFIVNLHNWNGESCISKEALNFAHTINVTLLTMEEFYEYIRKF